MPKFCIIGAGFAGLRAAIHFEQIGADYLLLEGSDRIGGRVYPFKYRNGYLHFGAEYVNGIDNEIYEIVKNKELLNKEEERTSDLWLLEEGTITVVDGEKVDETSLKIFHDFVGRSNETLYQEAQNPKVSQKSVDEQIDEHIVEFLKTTPKKDHNVFEKLCAIYKNYFQIEWSSPLKELSMTNLLTWDDDTDEEDSAVLNEFGFQTILQELISKIPKEKIQLNSKVKNINSQGSKAKITLDSGEVLSFDCVIVTCSLGYIKMHHTTLFTPNLSSEKQRAIGAMGFGNNLKVFLEYEKPWWPEETSTIMLCSEGETEDFMIFQPSSWAENILVCWVAGSGPSRIAQMTDSELKTLLDSHLKKQLKSMNVPNSNRVFHRNWITDEFALGSYSYLTPQQQGDQDITILGEPIENKERRPIICFAGEHTDLKMYQTTVGAARSGLREAVRVAEKFNIDK